MFTSTEIAERIKSICAERHVTIGGVLEQAGLGRNTMSNFKTSMPRTDTLAKIANVLDCSVDYLIGNTAEKEKPAAEGDELDAERQFWLDLYDNASDEQISQIINYAKYLMQQNQDK